MSAGPATRAGRTGAGEPTTRERVREVLGGRGFRRLFVARIASQAGDGVFQIAAADILLFDDPGPNPAVRLALITAFTLVPFSAVGPFLGVFIDRWERRRILAITPAVRAGLAALVPLVSGGKSAAFYALVLLVLSANRLFLSTMSAVLPQLVPEDDLLVANSVATTGGSVANVTGLGVGAALSGALGGASAALFGALAFGVTALLAGRIPVHRGTTPERAPLAEELRAVAAELVDGFRRIRSSGRTVYAFSAISTSQLLVGAMSGAITHYFIAVLGLDVGDASRLLAMIAVGIFAGVLLVPPTARRMRHDRLVPLAFAIAGAGVLGTGATLSRTSVVAGAVVVGVAYAFAKIPVDTIVQEEIPDAFRGRAFSAYDMLFNLTRTSGVALAAVAFSAGVASDALVAGVGAAYLAAVVVFFAWERRLHAGRPPALADLLPTGEMVTVRAYAGSRADEEPRALVVGGRELAVEAVEWRAVEERGGERRRVFVVRVAGERVRLSCLEETSRWEVDRILARPRPPEQEPRARP